uniref:Uncharacterized protein n=1 Tax=Arion vulgaris TaxID=1028688 RepID=A0A0B7AL58_9EUPU
MDEDEMEKDEEDDEKTNVVDELKSETLTEKLDEKAEEEVDSDKKVRQFNDKETNNDEPKSSVEIDVNIEIHEKKELVDSLKKDEPVGKSTCDVIKSPYVIKRKRMSVYVTEVKHVLQEIKSSVCYTEEDLKLEAELESDVMKVKTVPETIVDLVHIESLVKELPKEMNLNDKIDKDRKIEQVDKISEEIAAVIAMEQNNLQLKKVESEPERKDVLPEKVKTVRGKKNVAKDGKKSARGSDIVAGNIILELSSSVEQILPLAVPPSGKVEPSPYDFDAEVDTPWHPEITKKWEPSQKATVVKDRKESPTVSEEGDENDKKVKKKVKKKCISPDLLEISYMCQ